MKRSATFMELVQQCVSARQGKGEIPSAFVLDEGKLFPIINVDVFEWGLDAYDPDDDSDNCLWYSGLSDALKIIIID